VFNRNNPDKAGTKKVFATKAQRIYL